MDLVFESPVRQRHFRQPFVDGLEFRWVVLGEPGVITASGSDVFDGDFTVGNLALREALILANVNAGADTITFDPSGAFIDQHGISRDDLAQLWPQLNAARSEVLQTDLEQFASGKIPTEKQPLDAGFLEMATTLFSS